MRNGLRRMAVCLPLLLASACAGGGSPGGSNGAGRTSSDLLTQEQIRSYTNAYQAVEALRSRWLNARGPDSFSDPSQVLVYRDDMQLGGVGSLRTVSTVDVAYIRYYNGTDASARWGPGHGSGVIYVASASR
jgi:hypothetical protein